MPYIKILGFENYYFSVMLKENLNKAHRHSLIIVIYHNQKCILQVSHFEIAIDVKGHNWSCFYSNKIYVWNII